MIPPRRTPEETEALRQVALRRQRLASRLFVGVIACNIVGLAIFVLGPSHGRITDRPLSWSDWLLGALTIAAFVGLVIIGLVLMTAPKVNLSPTGRVVMDRDGFRHEPSPLVRAWSEPRTLRWEEVRGWAERPKADGMPAHLLVFSHDANEIEPLLVAERDGAYDLQRELIRRDLPQVDLADWARQSAARSRAAAERILERDFSPADRREAEAILRSRKEQPDSARIDQALLVMAGGDLDALRAYIGWADDDFRDVLMIASSLEKGQDFAYDLLRQQSELRLHADPLVRIHDSQNHGGAAKRDGAQSSSDGVITGKGFLVVRASCPGEVDVRVEMRRRPPESDATAWDSVRDARLVLTSYRLIVRGGSEPSKTAARMCVKPAAYHARVHRRMRDGRERIDVALWPVKAG